MPATPLLLLILSTHQSFADRPMRIHSVTDISHTFSFYFDGRFAKNYTQPIGGKDARNWGTLHKCDLSNVNLLVLQSEASPCPFFPQDIQAVRKFIESGGGVVVLGDHSRFRKEETYRLNELARAFGARFEDQSAAKPLKPAEKLKVEKVKTYGGKTISLEDDTSWDILIRDAKGRAVMARRSIGKGKLMLVSRALSGRQPNAEDPINADMWHSLLADLASGKKVDPSNPPHSTMPENSTDKSGLEIQCSDYLQPMADEIFAIYEKSHPLIEKIMGVPPAGGMLKKLILLPTGGGGFSSGVAIGLGVWWGNFPDKKYGMVELVGHEATHSWVLPFPEPMWNEGIATYVGILLGRESGLNKEADATLTNWIKGAKRHDPKMDLHDLAKGKDVPHVVHMAKPMWIFEQLRKEEPQIVSKYFQAKRKLIDPKKQKRYTADDSVAVLSVAAGRNLFDWFKTLGIDVDESQTKVPCPDE
ncbi:MAG: hypothetical protein QGG53_24575 [Planctomycetota bacterium]|nr:hypothetical protein [Planctomycetota bacterium]